MWPKGFPCGKQDLIEYLKKELNILKKSGNKHEIDSLNFEVQNQELAGKSGSGWLTAVQLTLAGRCGKWFTGSYECTSNHVKCGQLFFVWQLFM